MKNPFVMNLPDLKISDNKLEMVKEESKMPFEVVSNDSVSKDGYDSTDELDMPHSSFVQPLNKCDLSEYPPESMTPTEIRQKGSNENETDGSSSGRLNFL